jgi:tetratricopeptide (TPR) repeat protein
LAKFREARLGRGEARALNALGYLSTLDGDHRQCIVYCEQALLRLAETPDRIVEADTWDSLGAAHRALAEYSLSVECYRRSLALYASMQDRTNQAETLESLADTYIAAGAVADARATLREADGILEELNAPGRERIRDKLAGLDRDAH